MGPPARFSPNYPDPPPPTNPTDDPSNFADLPKLSSVDLVKAAKKFDALVAALPLSEGGEEAQLKKMAELQNELKLVQELYNEAADNCLNLKKPD